MGMARGGGEDGKARDPCAIKSCTQEATKGVSIRFCEEHYEEFRSSMKVRYLAVGYFVVIWVSYYILGMCYIYVVQRPNSNHDNNRNVGVGWWDQR